MVVGGHFDCVQDMAWDPQKGEYLLSVSLDQTARLHAYWKTDDQQKVPVVNSNSLCEI